VALTKKISRISQGLRPTISSKRAGGFIELMQGENLSK
jgi:hypothetical protein